MTELHFFTLVFRGGPQDGVRIQDHKLPFHLDFPVFNTNYSTLEEDHPNTRLHYAGYRYSGVTQNGEHIYYYNPPVSPPTPPSAHIPLVDLLPVGQDIPTGGGVLSPSARAELIASLIREITEEFSTPATDPNFVSYDAMGVRFDGTEADKEMAEWDKILHGRD